MVPQFWRLEVHSEGVSRAGSLLPGRWPSFPRLHLVLLPGCVCVLTSFLIRTAVRWD